MRVLLWIFLASLFIVSTVTILQDNEESMLITMEPLSNRELAVLRLIVQGVRNSEIGQCLSISVKTLETHLTSLYSKLGVQSRAEAIAWHSSRVYCWRMHNNPPEYQKQEFTQTSHGFTQTSQGQHSAYVIIGPYR